MNVSQCGSFQSRCWQNWTWNKMRTIVRKQQTKRGSKVLFCPLPFSGRVSLIARCGRGLVHWGTCSHLLPISRPLLLQPGPDFLPDKLQRGALAHSFQLARNENISFNNKKTILNFFSALLVSSKFEFPYSGLQWTNLLNVCLLMKHNHPLSACRASRHPVEFCRCWERNTISAV